jgi:hypothetical protein
MRTTPNGGLTVWDLETDEFSHVDMAGNLDAIDTLFGASSTHFEVSATLPVSNLYTGRIVMLSGASGGFAAYNLVRYDGTAWRPVNQMEIQPAVPTQGNFPGRVVILSNADGGFNAWSVIRFDGASWGIVGGWSSVQTGLSANNIKGLQSNGDVYVSDSGRGLVLTDRQGGATYRIVISGGNLALESVV